jgi:hypothetical protein
MWSQAHHAITDRHIADRYAGYGAKPHVLVTSEFRTMAKTTARSIELEPIDRLEEKVKLLVGMIERMKTEQAQASQERQRLSAEVETLRGRLAANETLSNELSLLREERDVIRSRVGEMLEQLEALSL